MPPADGEQHALDQRLEHDLLARGAEREPYRGLAARATARASSRLATLAQAISSTRPQTPSRMRRLRRYCSRMMPMPAPAGTTVITCFGRPWITSGIQLDGIAGVVLHPLPQDARQARADGVRGGPRLQPPDHPQPGGGRLAEQRRLAGDQRLLLQRYPQKSAGSPRSVSPKNPGGVTPTTVNGCPSTTSVAPIDLGIAAVGGLPRVVAHDDDRRGRGRVVLRGEDPAAERRHAQGGEVVAVDVRSAERARDLVDALAAVRSAAPGRPGTRSVPRTRGGRPSAARSAGTRTCPSDPAARPGRSSCRHRRCGRGGPDR